MMRFLEKNTSIFLLISIVHCTCGITALTGNRLILLHGMQAMGQGDCPNTPNIQDIH